MAAEAEKAWLHHQGLDLSDPVPSYYLAPETRQFRPLIQPAFDMAQTQKINNVSQVPYSYNDVSTSNACQAVSLHNNVRVFQLKKKPILVWTYKNITASLEWFNESKGPSESENKILM
jgi:hypothetical protein